MQTVPLASTCPILWLAIHGCLQQWLRDSINRFAQPIALGVFGKSEQLLKLHQVTHLSRYEPESPYHSTPLKGTLLYRTPPAMPLLFALSRSLVMRPLGYLVAESTTIRMYLLLVSDTGACESCEVHCLSLERYINQWHFRLRHYYALTLTLR